MQSILGWLKEEEKVLLFRAGDSYRTEPGTAGGLAVFYPTVWPFKN